MEKISFKYINDGDTITTTKPKRTLRFVLVNTTEIDHKLPSKSQPMSREAQEFLGRLSKENKNQAYLYKLGEDKYKRTLALISFDKETSVNSLLLEQGLGFFTAFEQQDSALTSKLFACHKKAENAARKKKIGLWQPGIIEKFSVDAKELNAYGFHLVKGRITNISHSKRGSFVDIENKLRVFIPHTFKKSAYWRVDFAKLQHLQVRGWVQKNKFKNQSPFFMKISHPLMIEENTLSLF